MQKLIVLSLVAVLVGGTLAATLNGCSSDDSDGASVKGKPWRFLSPLPDARKGEWALYDAENDNTVEHRVLRNLQPQRLVQISMESRNKIGGILGAPQAVTKPYNYFIYGYDKAYGGAGWIVEQIYVDRITAAGREWDCLCVRFLTPGNVAQWYSHEVPVSGVLREVQTRGRTKVVTLELKKYGWTDDTTGGAEPERKEGK